MENPLTEIRTLDSRTVYENRWMRVREDQIERTGGHRGLYGVVEKTDFAVIVPLTETGTLLVEQYRYPVGGRFWEFPQGSWEGVDLAPQDLARAELREETGFTAGRIEEVGRLFVAYGYSNQAYGIFTARDLVPGQTDLDEEERGLVSGAFTWSQVERMIMEGTIRDATTVAAFGLLKLKGLIR